MQFFWSDVLTQIVNTIICGGWQHGLLSEMRVQWCVFLQLWEADMVLPPTVPLQVLQSGNSQWSPNYHRRRTYWPTLQFDWREDVGGALSPTAHLSSSPPAAQTLHFHHHPASEKASGAYQHRTGTREGWWSQWCSAIALTVTKERSDTSDVMNGNKRSVEWHTEFRLDIEVDTYKNWLINNQFPFSNFEAQLFTLAFYKCLME